MSDKVIVINGASGDIGRVITQTLLTQGYQVAACVRAESANKLAAHKNLTVFPCDITDLESVKACVSQLKENYKKVYGLINCVGMAHGSPMLMTKIDDLRQVFEVNFFALIQFTQLIAKRMLRSREGCIINLASTAGILSDKGTMAYGGSKAALIHTTKVMASELGAYNIRVNAIAPAVVESAMADLMDESAIESLDTRAALSGVITAKEVADSAVFLLSDSAKNITSQVITLDRGISS